MKDAEEAHIRIKNMYLLTELGGGGEYLQDVRT